MEALDSAHPSEYAAFIKLFNQKRYFEAHEVLEDLWRLEKGPARNFYQGLIQLAAVYVHLQKETPKGAERLLETATAHLKPYEPVYMGLNITQLLHKTGRAVGKGGDWPKIVTKT